MSDARSKHIFELTSDEMGMLVHKLTAVSANVTIALCDIADQFNISRKDACEVFANVSKTVSDRIDLSYICPSECRELCDAIQTKPVLSKDK